MPAGRATPPVPPGPRRLIPFGPARNSMVGENRMSAILCGAALHVTADAVHLGRVRFREFAFMTRPALCVVALRRWGGRRMRIVTGPAPQFAPAITLACAPCQLFGVADDLEPRRPRADVNREHILRAARPRESRQIFSGVKNPLRRAGKMALLADAVASRRRQLRRIQNISRLRPLQMFFHRTMAALARNRLFGKNRRLILIRRAAPVQRLPGVA